MRSLIVAVLAQAGLLLLAGCATMEATGRRAPEPLKKVDVARFYTGVWREIGRRPMSITDGCVAGATEYSRDTEGRIVVLDTCRQGTPNGELTSIGGLSEILDPGVNAKLRVYYRLYGVIPIQRDYWVLDHADDYSWFISADPTFLDLFIYTRNPAVPPAELRHLVNRAKALGYDVSKLEFPAQPPR